MAEDSPEQLDTRTRLLEAGILCFAQKGFEGAGIREIAQLAQANSALVQYHFGGKEGLYLATLWHVFELGAHRVDDLPPPPAPGDPEARPRAIAAIRAHVASFLRDCLCGCKFGGAFSEQLERAALLLWNREIQSPQPSTRDFIREAIRPYVRHLVGCLKVLRPDLDEEGLLRMDMSIHAQLAYLHNHTELIGLIRGRAFEASDFPSLLDHFTTFSLRGLGLSDTEILAGA